MGSKSPKCLLKKKKRKRRHRHWNLTDKIFSLLLHKQKRQALLGSFDCTSKISTRLTEIALTKPLRQKAMPGLLSNNFGREGGRNKQIIFHNLSQAKFPPISLKINKSNINLPKWFPALWNKTKLLDHIYYWRRQSHCLGPISVMMLKNLCFIGLFIPRLGKIRKHKDSEL